MVRYGCVRCDAVMSGVVVTGGVESGNARQGDLGFCSAMPGRVRKSLVRQSTVWSGKVRQGDLWCGKVELGLVKSGWVGRSKAR